MAVGSLLGGTKHGSPHVSIALALILSASSLSAFDLEKIDHPIRKEPAYQSKSPKYCLVARGPKAETRVWLVLDGEVLYVDRNGNGDLTEAGEQVRITTPNQDPANFGEVEISVAPGDVKPKLSAAAWGWLRRNGNPERPLEISLSATMGDGTRFVAWGDETSPLKFADRASEAPVVHFGGPPQMGLEIRQPLGRKSADTFEINMAVGCKGRGPGTFAALIYTPVPKDAYPRAVFEFPGPTPDPIKVDTIIKQRC